MRKVMMGSMMVLAGTGARQTGLVDFSPQSTAQLALVPTEEVVTRAEPVIPARTASLLTPAEADAEARATPSRLENAADFDPADFVDRTGRVLETGEASYYGRGFAGRPTANGETFDPQEMTAAHKTLPLGSVIRVTNTANGKSLVLRVNDRGPYAHGRVLDVSQGAAEELGMIDSGTANVRIEVL